MDLDGAIDELQARLRRYPADRYPVQHATAAFHLGVATLEQGRAEEAEVALRTAMTLFDPDRLPVEHAKAANLLGAALRAQGDLPGAASAFLVASEAFVARELPLEHGAAQFNLGLAMRESADPSSALPCFEAALRRFDEGRLPGQASAAARELGATLLALGELEPAAAALERALDLASAAGDQTALGAAANALGLAYLAAERIEKAVEVFRTAVVTSPRGLRPEAFAMAKANLALAYQRADDVPHARLAARQALGTPGAPEAVLGQATGVMEGLGEGEDDLHAVLDGEAPDRWPPILREECARWLDAPATERQADLGAWIDGQLARAYRGPDLAEAWLGVLLELPPAAMDRLIRSTLLALAERDPGARERFTSQVSRTLPRFHIPQWLRLRDTFNRIAEELGQEQVWG